MNLHAFRNQLHFLDLEETVSETLCPGCQCLRFERRGFLNKLTPTGIAAVPAVDTYCPICESHHIAQTLGGG